MKKITFVLLLLALLPLEAKALNPYDNSQILSYVAMPLAVSAVCDIRGVQTDRVGELVTYMNQANVEPTDFIDVFRYVPVALVLRTDNRPDFVGWVRGEVDRGLMGQDLVTSMESRLRTYDDYVPVSHYRTHRRYTRESYAYAYEPDYVPVTIRHHCDQLLLDPLTLVEMPIAVTNVYDLGVPYDRVSSLVVELNLGGVAPVQFVEVMRYAPAALVAPGDYYGQPDFVQFVRTRRLGGINGYPLVQAVNQQLQYYNVAPRIDYAPPLYANQNYYIPPVAQNFVEPASPAFFPPTVARMASNFGAGRTVVNQPTPAIVAAPQVQRLLESQNGGAVIANPAQARRELARANRAQREVPIAAVPVPFAPGRIENQGRGRAMEQQPVIASPPAIASTPRGNGRGHERATTPVPTPMISSAPPAPENGHGRGRAASAPSPSFVPAPAATPAPPRERGNGHGHEAPTFVPAPAAVPAAPQEHGNGHGHGAPAFVPAPAAVPAPPQEHGHGHGAPAPVAVSPAPVTTPAPAPAVQEQHGHGHGQPADAGQPAAPPGQEKKKGKGHD